MATSGRAEDERTGAVGVLDKRTILRGGDLTAPVLTLGADLRTGGTAAARSALSARSMARNPNGSESDARMGVLVSSYSYRALEL